MSEVEKVMGIVIVVLLICAGIVGYYEQKEVQYQVNVVDGTFIEIEKAQLGFNTEIEVWHDDKRNVTCWLWEHNGPRGGMSCIPDHMLTP